jgi:hypothetical protein
LEIWDYEDKRDSAKFTTTEAEKDAISAAMHSIHDLLLHAYPGLRFEATRRDLDQPLMIPRLK